MNNIFDSLWEGIETKVESKVYVFLRNSHDEYMRLQKQRNEIVEKYPILINLVEESGQISLTEEEHAAFRQFVVINDRMTRLEMQAYYFCGHADFQKYKDLLAIFEK